MTKADKKHFGAGSRGKGSGAGAMSELPGKALRRGAVLSNRDKKQHTKQRGQDSAGIENEDYIDRDNNQRSADWPRAGGPGRKTKKQE